ncbi:hypothetical protein [Povalibacter sp.]|uniref:hypothetical protein n=1 Tax=Povalibacter sp. TaxID=1962978 RepID=UPI002F40D566
MNSQQIGVEEGRKTFANTLRYILSITSANLSNMPFLPLIAGLLLWVFDASQPSLSLPLHMSPLPSDQALVLSHRSTYVTGARNYLCLRSIPAS